MAQLLVNASNAKEYGLQGDLDDEITTDTGSDYDTDYDYNTGEESDSGNSRKNNDTGKDIRI